MNNKILCQLNTKTFLCKRKNNTNKIMNVNKLT